MRSRSETCATRSSRTPCRGRQAHGSGISGSSRRANFPTRSMPMRMWRRRARGTFVPSWAFPQMPSWSPSRGVSFPKKAWLNSPRPRRRSPSTRDANGRAVHLIIAGAGPKQGDIERIECGNIHLVGRLGRQDLAALMSQGRRDGAALPVGRFRHNPARGRGVRHPRNRHPRRVAPTSS